MSINRDLGYDPTQHEANMRWLKEQEAERKLVEPDPKAAIQPSRVPVAALVNDAGIPDRIKVVVRAATTDRWIGVAYCKDYTGDPSTIHEYYAAPAPPAPSSDAQSLAQRFIGSGDNVELRQKALAEAITIHAHQRYVAGIEAALEAMTEPYSDGDGLRTVDPRAIEEARRTLIEKTNVAE